MEIVTFSEPGFDSYFSGNTTDVCPVGALTDAGLSLSCATVGAHECSQPLQSLRGGL